MFLRKLVVALCPVALCAVVCTVFRWVDGWLGSTAFLSFALKGAAMGAALALTLPIAGVKAHTNGLTGWLFSGAALLLAALAYQYLESMGAVNVPLLRALMAVNGQVVLAEGAAAGYLLAAALWYRRR